MKNSCIKTIATGKGEMTVNICKMFGKCENKDCECKKGGRKSKMNKWNLKHKLAAILIISLFVLAACSQANNTMADHMMPTREISEAKTIDRGLSGLTEAKNSQIVELKDGQILQMEAKPVVKEIDGNRIRMY